jgi:hypothetical protein
MEGHHEGRMVPVLGQEFHPNLDIHVALAAVNPAEFPHLALFRKAQVFDRPDVLFNGQLLQLPSQGIYRVFIRKQICDSKFVCVPLIPVLINLPLSLKSDCCVILQRIPEILQVGPYLRFALDPCPQVIHSWLPPSLFGIN